MSKINRQQVYDKYQGHCAYCGDSIKLNNMQVDHIIPQRNFQTDIYNKVRVPSFLSHLTKDDVDHIDNLNPACRVCNKWKDVFDLQQFRVELSMQTPRLNERSASYRMAKKYGLIEEVTCLVEFYFEKIKPTTNILLLNNLLSKRLS